MADSGVRIAIVDDDALVCKALARLLRASGYIVQTYGSAAAFLASLGQDAPQCLVVDLKMPEMSGLDLHRHLGRIHIRIPAILITAHGDPAIRDEALGEGMIDCLTKPLQEAALLAAIRTATA
jgi:FixJ family two-component response regulator